MTPASVYPVPEIAFAAVALFLLLASVACAAYLLLRPVGGRATWGIGEMFAITILFVVALPMGAILIGVVEPLTLATLSVVTIIQNALFAGLSAYVVMVRYRQHPLQLGVRLDGWRALVATGIVAALLTIPLSIASEHLAIVIYALFDGSAQATALAAAEHMTDPLRPVFDQLSGSGQSMWFLFLLAVVVPIGEEVFFRGLVYSGLRSRWGTAVAALASAAFFAAVHVQVIHGLPIFVLGVILAALYERTGSLVPPIVTHGVNNIIAVIAVWRGWEI
jgi:membrane protease YdiL (CAAX protease family)